MFKNLSSIVVQTVAQKKLNKQDVNMPASRASQVKHFSKIWLWNILFFMVTALSSLAREFFRKIFNDVRVL